MVDPLPNYVQLVSGLSKATRARARGAARAVLAQAGLDDVATDAGERISRMAEEIMAASRANRELLENLVTAEVDKAAERLGFVRQQDLTDLRAEVAVIRTMMDLQQPRTAPTDPPAAAAPAPKKTAPKKTAPKKTASKTAAAKTAAASATTKTPAKRAPAKKTPAKKTDVARSTPTTTAPTKAAARGAVSDAEDRT